MRKLKILKACRWAQRDVAASVLYFTKDEIRCVDDYLADKMIENNDAIIFDADKISKKKVDMDELSNKKVNSFDNKKKNRNKHAGSMQS